jgi:hypothetical protein
MTHALLCAYYPQQLLPGLAGLLELRRHLGHERFAPASVLVLGDPSAGEHFLALRRQTFEQLLRPFGWVRLVFPGAAEVRAELSPNFRVARKARHLRQRFGADAFAVICYAHDMGHDFFAQSAMQAFPRARRACFGDALGVVYSNDYYTRQTYPLGTLRDFLRAPRAPLVNLLWRAKRAYTLPARGRRLDAEFAVPILPSDPGGDFLPGKTLLPVQRDVLDLVLDQLVQAAEVGGAAASRPDRHLMLLGSFSESGFTTEALERDMYVEAARRHVPPGAPLLLKAHPASYGAKLQAIADALRAHCQVELSGADPLPIEALRGLAASRSVISFSYSSVSLHYLHGSNVVHAMTADLIERYFPPAIRGWMQESNELYLQQFELAKRMRREQLAEDATKSGLTLEEPCLNRN